MPRGDGAVANVCGIAGIFNAHDPAGITAMTAALSHRGPDDGGVINLPDTPASLGHRRLSIVDLSPAGHQPMTSPDGRYTLVFNGEIYNHRELRQTLVEQGERFAGHSDSEVLLQALRVWGLGALPRLRGMFAFGLLDRGPARGWGAGFAADFGPAPHLLLARDRLGIKPLVHVRVGKRVYFASELRALRAHPDLQLSLDPAAAVDVLAYGAVQQPRTMFAGVQQLAPGTARVMSAQGQERAHRYWDGFRDTQSLRDRLAHADAAEQVAGLRQRLEAAAAAHLVADVEVGAFLSGGLDSAVVTALMVQHGATRPKTFTLGFEHPRQALDATVADERVQARRLAAHLGTDHHEVVVGSAEVIGKFDAMLSALDQPSVDGLNTYLVSEATAGTVKVALSGLGGDELFAGYPHFAHGPRRRLGTPVSHLASTLHRVLPNRLTYGYLSRHGNDATRLSLARLRRSGLRLRWLLGPRLLEASVRSQDPLAERDGLDGRAASLPARNPSADAITLMSLYELEGYLCSTLLRDVDAMSMAHGLEVRPVLLDHEVVEYALALPPQAKVSAGVGKAVLRQAAADLLPAETLRGGPKRGFELPFADWLNGPLRSRVGDLTRDRKLRSLLSRPLLSELRLRARMGRLERRHWSIVVLAEWLRASGLM